MMMRLIRMIKRKGRNGSKKFWPLGERTLVVSEGRICLAFAESSDVARL